VCSNDKDNYLFLEELGHSLTFITELDLIEEKLYQVQPSGFIIDYTISWEQIIAIINLKNKLQHQYIPSFFILLESVATEIRYKYRFLGIDAVFIIDEIQSYLSSFIDVECEKYETERDRVRNLATFPEISQDPLCLINANGDLLYSNNKFYQNINWANWEGLKEKLVELVKGLLYEKKNLDIEWVDGDKYYQVAIIKNPKREWFNIYFNDITKQKKLEIEIKEQTAFYKDILDNIPSDIAVFSNEHRYLYVNKNGIKDPELREWMIGKTDFDYVKMRNSNPEIALRRRDIFNRTAESREEAEWIDEVVRPDGNSKYIIRRFHPVYEETNEDKLKLMIGYGVDITENIKISNELRHLTDTLSRQNEELRRFTYIISHDLKSPLINLTTLVDLVRNPNIKDDAKEQAITMIGNNAQKLSNTITELAQTIQMKDQVISDTKAVSNWYDTINEIVANYQYLIDKKSMTVELGVSLTAEVYFSKSGLISIIQNLLSNAVKYKVSNRKLKVQISLYNNSDYQILTITDNGMGLDLNRVKDRLFNLYQRFHPETEGKGLGLYLVKSIIESAGGKIEVDSELNIGTTFRLYFPIATLKSK